jgi:NADPH-dependent glutamate synthase beta subunit-like oxidoreductase
MNTPLIPPTWTTGSTEAIRTGTWRAALPRHIAAPSPCHAACPVGGDIAEWIGLARAQDWRGAWNVLVRHNPFPAIAGRICHHPCESACNRGAYDEALSICRLERFVGDIALRERWRFDAPAREHGGRAAVVGAGPSGLSAAYHLRRRGWKVRVFETQPLPGGLMRYGIPSYRLAREVLDAEIMRIVDFGVEIRCCTSVADAQALQRLRSEHDAVYLAIGAARVRRLPQLDYREPWVVDGSAWLAACNIGRALPLGNDVIVVGGGSAALDAARSARRAGHAVTIVSLESRAQMPAQPEEVAEALEEGITLVDGATLVAARSDGDGVHVELRRVRFEPGAQRGQFRVDEIAGSDFVLRTDAVITSIGQDPDLAALGETAVAAQGRLLGIGADHASGVPGVWAGGDVASMDRFVTAAVGHGERAAMAIEAARGGVAGPAPDERATVPLGAIATWYHPHGARASVPLRAVADRLTGQAEVQLGLSAAQALAEAGRCFSCGLCIACDNCVHYCPDLAVGHAVGGGYTVLGDYCKGCGLCVRECPTGSMEMVEEAK